MIKAVVFDMDGLLIDSEPLWYEAKIKAFGKVGLHLTYEMCRQSSGLRLDGVIDYWYNKYPWNTSSNSKKEVADDLLKIVMDLMEKKIEKMPGVDNALNFVKIKGVKIALASSSPLKMIKLVLRKLEIENYFDEVLSAEFEEYGKPHPAIYLKSAQSLGISPEQCLVFEDSPNGLLSAKSAKMKCVCVPDKSQRNDPRFGIADEILSSLSEFNEEVWDKLNK